MLDAHSLIRLAISKDDKEDKQCWLPTYFSSISHKRCINIHILWSNSWFLFQYNSVQFSTVSNFPIFLIKYKDTISVSSPINFCFVLSNSTKCQRNFSFHPNWVEHSIKRELQPSPGNLIVPAIEQESRRRIAPASSSYEPVSIKTNQDVGTWNKNQEKLYFASQPWRRKKIIKEY